jgi:hypothetical protein
MNHHFLIFQEEDSQNILLSLLMKFKASTQVQISQLLTDKGLRVILVHYMLLLTSISKHY